MVSSQQGSRARCLSVGIGVTVAYVALAVWLLPVVTSGGVATFDAALVRACAVLGLGTAGWLWLAAVTTALGALSGRQHVPGVPAPLRQAVLAACGVALTGGLLATAPAHATPGPQHHDRVARPGAVVAGLPLPDRATAPAPTAPQAVVVAPGDTLWTIAARTLGPAAADAEIDAAWRHIYRLNRAEIGPDPDLIRPAQRLEVLP